MTGKWRPSLAMVLGGALAVTLALALAGMVALRYLGPEIGFRNAAVALGAAITLATVGLGWLLVRLLLRPIKELQAFAHARETGTEARQIRHFGTRELHQTARAVVTMGDALADRAATVRAFTDHVTHELKTPVAAIRAAHEILEDDLRDQPQMGALLADIDGARRQIEHQLDALRAVARAREARYIGTTRLDDLTRDLADTCPGLDITLTGGEVPVPLAPDGVRIVLGHLLSNAADQGARHLNIDVQSLPTETLLTLSDDGPGVSPGHADRIFDPFFTTRRDSGGTGMGLAIVRAILGSHGAEITLDPTRPGARFVLRFRRLT